MTKKHLAYLALFAEVFIIGISVPLMKINLQTIPPITLSFFRFAIASFLALSLTDFRKVTFKDIMAITGLAFFGVTLNVGLFAVGLKTTSTIDAVLIIALGPVVTSFLAVFAIREKINSLHLTGIIIACLGALFYTLYPFIFGMNGLKLNLVGDLWVAGAMLSAAIYAIGSKKLFEKYSPSTIAGVSFLVGAFSFLPGSISEAYTNPWAGKITTFNIVSIIFLGVGLAFLAYLFSEWSLSKLDVHTVSTAGYLAPVISIAIAAFFLGDYPNPSFLISALLIVIGIFLVIRSHPKVHPHLHLHLHKIKSI